MREIGFTVEKSGLYDIVIEGITQSSDEKSVRVDALNQDDGKKHKKKKANDLVFLPLIASFKN